MYTFESRIRYSEADSRGRLSIPALMDYFQDCSTFQSNDVGYGCDWLMENNRAWVVNYWQIDIKRLPVIGERVVIGTNPYEIRSFLGLRNFFMDGEDGERAVIANSVWSFLDLEKGEVIRAPEEMKTAYGLAERLEMEYLPRKLPFPKEGEIRECRPVRVEPAYIDTNRHMNNVWYIRHALDAAYDPAGPEENAGASCDVPVISRIRAEYRMQARLGDILHIRLHTDPSADIRTVRMEDEEGSPYCTIQLCGPAIETGGGSDA